MAEALAIAAVAPAFIQLGVYGAKFIKALAELSEDMGQAEEEMSYISHRIEGFTELAKMTVDILTQHCKNYPESVFVTNLCNEGIMENLAQQSKFVKRLVRNAQKQIQNKIRSSYWWWAVLRWHFYRPAIMAVFPEVEQIKSTLALIMSVTNFDIYSIKLAEVKESGMLREMTFIVTEMRKMKIRLNEELRIAQGLRAECDHRRRDNDKNAEWEAEALRKPHAIDALFSIAMRIVETPDPPEPMEVPLPSVVESEVELRSPSSPQPDPAPLTSASPTPKEAESEPTTPVGEERVSSARSSSKIVRVVKDTAIVREKAIGFVHFEGTNNKVVAWLIPSMSENLITIKQAKRMELRVEPLEDGEGLTLQDVDLSTISCVGKVRLEWRLTAGESRTKNLPLVVQCWAFKKLPVPAPMGLVLGRPFAMEQLRNQTVKGKRS